MFASGSVFLPLDEQAASASATMPAATPASPRECPEPILISRVSTGRLARDRAEQPALTLRLERPLALSQRSQAQGVELDEARRVLLVVGALVVLERHQRRGIQRRVALAAGDDDVALVQLEPHRALDHLLRLVARRLQDLALRREPEAVVDQLGIARHQLVL